MIAVQAAESERTAIAEFFELFKTPWKFSTQGGSADVLVCSHGEAPATDARLVLIYGGQAGPVDAHRQAVSGGEKSDGTLLYQGEPIPIYGRSLAFKDAANPVLKHDSGEPAMTMITANGRSVVRIGYDLFQEIRILLTCGQPEASAEIPTLERHIALLRDLIVGAGIPLFEIPPVPAGSAFIACLTHDVDHVGIRNHKFDHTMFGFLARATLGSLRDVFRGRKNWRQLGENWLAALKLPLVHLGLARDFWYQFDHYVGLENGLPSTFFVIPKKGETGLDENGDRPARRAASYAATELKPILRGLGQAGKEIGVHGLDAWRDAVAGRDESAIISRLTGATELGVRMHWLYFNEQSPVQLEQAGFSYDSTMGYNATVGYRAGTTQVFKPLLTAKLLELPMHIMDTALFYPSYLNLSARQAEEKIRPFIAHADHCGGVLTVNWHDRSIAPERLWDGTYRRIIGECKAAGAWFATAAQTVAWFKKRRSVVFEETDGGIKIKTAGGREDLPGLRVRTFQSGAGESKFVDRPLSGDMEIALTA